MSPAETSNLKSPSTNAHGSWLPRVAGAGAKVSFGLHSPDGSRIQVGDGVPAFELYVRNRVGLRALQSVNELRVAEAYIQGDIDIEGDFVAAMSLRHAFSDRNLWIKLWRRLAPALFGRERFNPTWVAKHYDLNHIQFFATETQYRTYTPGIYESGDSMEEGAERKLDFAFRSLGLRCGQTVLDIGCGWGGFLRYAAARGVRVKGITLSKHQVQFVEDLIRDKRFDAEVAYQDFFTLPPQQRYDAIVMMGVIEDLSDYPRVMRRLPHHLQPGGRVYLDFATTRKPFDTSSFVTRYIWPGTFRLVYLPELIDAVNASPFDLHALYNDRENYHLWGQMGHDRWVENQKAILERASMELWRTIRLLTGGVASLMSTAEYGVGAQRMILELPVSYHVPADAERAGLNVSAC